MSLVDSLLEGWIWLGIPICFISMAVGIGLSQSAVGLASFWWLLFAAASAMIFVDCVVISERNLRGEK